jgi:hypothetical protein
MTILRKKIKGWSLNINKDIRDKKSNLMLNVKKLEWPELG